jgi:hypothetical protein
MADSCKMFFYNTFMDTSSDDSSDDDEDVLHAIALVLYDH